MLATAMPTVTPLALTDDDARLAAVRRRDPGADGRFLYSVATTGVYCHPSCAARPALRRNIAFHANREAAERAGFRACKRCRPDLPPRAEREAALVAAACRCIELSADAPSLADLAAQARAQPASLPPPVPARRRGHARGLCRGPPPGARATQPGRRQPGDGGALRGRVQLVRTVLRGGGRRCWAWRRPATAMAARARRSAMRSASPAWAACWWPRPGAACAPFCWATTPAALAGRPACALPAGGARRGAAGVRRLGRAGRGRDRAAGAGARASARHRRHGLPAPRLGGVAGHPRRARRSATAPSRHGWDSPRPSRAVAGACAANALAVAIPCHRVVGGDGGLAGYRWGVERKRALLARERG